MLQANLATQPSGTSADALALAIDYWTSLFDRTRKRNKILCTCMRVLIILLSGLVTITLAVDLSNIFSSIPSSYFKLAAIVFSAVGVSIGTFEAFIDHKRLWVQCGLALAQATLLRQRLSVAAGRGEVDDVMAQSILKDLKAIVDFASKNWADSRTRSPDVLNQENFGQRLSSGGRRKQIANY
jgi:hypothetical protein